MGSALVWLIAVSVVLSLALCYGFFWVIVKWIMSDAPAGTRFAGIVNYGVGKKDPEETAGQ